MAKPNLIKQFNTATNQNIILDKDLNKVIKNSYELFLELFKNSNLDVKKLGDFKYKSFFSNTKEINLDLSIIKYFPNQYYKFIDFNNIVLDIFKNLPERYVIKKNNNYIAVLENFKGYNINYRFILFFRKKTKDLIVDYVNRNSIVQEDFALKISESLCIANKISNGTLFNIKKILNYILKNHFEYSYNLDYLLITWFYEYVARSLNDFIDQRFNFKNKELDLNNFRKIKNLKLWFKEHVNINKLFYYIFSKVDSWNSYYFNELGYEKIEIFTDISRYSLNTNSTFNNPSSFFSEIKIYDLQNHSDLVNIQNNISMENGVSKIAYDKARAEEKRYFVSPFICTGTSNFAMLQKWFTLLSTKLYAKLPSKLKEEIKSLKQREAMEELNIIAHNWLSSYLKKIKYLTPYFDRKYPLAYESDLKTLIRLIVTMVDKTKDEDWIMENDN
ncbi:hypothetical protein SGLAD_v1c03900 [Spiroplasma gladiatoris]|uniref:Uncharacterized protein n=1 Tax=Spiroplasma gladiatoris TaxID=2143 RepID=A0A4V1AQ82_9MOLU|nr:hypothetical protein [Spiroplasma gladiatoris]QBQ07589.1 hypothetical protein SGLAD_v1c03900 [Spiroplasma gladiatoris]